MIERIAVSLLLLAIGFAVYRTFARYHVGRAAASANGDPILSDLRPGVPAIVYFSTPSCVPCRTHQEPALRRLQDELRDAIQIIRIDASEDPAAADRWGIFSAPTTFVLDGHGQPRKVNHGVVDTETLKRQIQGV